MTETMVNNTNMLAELVEAKPGQEGLFDHMFDHRQLRNTRKQWS